MRHKNRGLILEYCIYRKEINPLDLDCPFFEVLHYEKFCKFCGYYKEKCGCSCCTILDHKMEEKGM